jgi:hypothetical protein
VGITQVAITRGMAITAGDITGAAIIVTVAA